MTEKEFRNILRNVLDMFLSAMRESGFHHNPTPCDINNGFCDTFARKVRDVVPEARVGFLSDANKPYDPETCLHACVDWRGKFYDAECLSGVKDWRKLPFIKNRGKSREKAPQKQMKPGIKGRL